MRLYQIIPPCYLENRVVREPCKQRIACIYSKKKHEKRDEISSNLPVCSQKKHKIDLTDRLQCNCPIKYFVYLSHKSLQLVGKF